MFRFFVRPSKTKKQVIAYCWVCLFSQSSLLVLCPLCYSFIYVYIYIYGFFLQSFISVLLRLIKQACCIKDNASAHPWDSCFQSASFNANFRRPHTDEKVPQGGAGTVQSFKVAFHTSSSEDVACCSVCRWPLKEHYRLRQQLAGIGMTRTLRRLRFGGGHQACSCQTSEPSHRLTLSPTLRLQFRPPQQNVNSSYLTWNVHAAVLWLMAGLFFFT